MCSISKYIFRLPRSEAVSRSRFSPPPSPPCLYPGDVLFWALNWIKLVQNGSNLSKLEHTCPKWIKHVQTCPNLNKLVQNWSNLFSAANQNSLPVFKLYVSSILLRDIRFLQLKIKFFYFHFKKSYSADFCHFRNLNQQNYVTNNVLSYKERTPSRSILMPVILQFF